MNYSLGESLVGSSCYDINANLVDKINYDHPAVFRRLRVLDVDESFVLACAASLKEKRKDDIEHLKKVVEEASQEELEFLEFKETDNKANDEDGEERSGNYGTAEEEEMYDPLVRLFTHIANFDNATRPPRPNAARSWKWRDRDAFAEVKPTKEQGSIPATRDTIAPIMSQAANYARLFISARPFMLFYVGILIFGTEFCVGIFDRDGITLSPIYDMFQDIEMFIRVVSRLACDLSIQELGFDPTVCILSDEETERLTGQKKYPSAVVSSTGNDERLWCTIGPPIWSSCSLVGRGTHVWLVREYILGNTQSYDHHKLPCLRGGEMIMKTTWRSSAGISKPDIYLSIDAPIPGLAKFECGGDVMFPGSAEYPISVRNLRCHVRDFLRDHDTHRSLITPVLHRLIIGTVGRPMWEYTSDLDLLTGFRDALRAHQHLCNQGILHCDISAGNVLLSKDKTAPFRGFITDLECAHIESLAIRQPEVTVEQDVSLPFKQGVNITGTTQFMAVALLRNKNAPHGVVHDLESFLWVLSYCVMRSLYHRASREDAPKDVQDQFKDEFRSIFRDAFGEVTGYKLTGQRHSGSTGLCFPKYVVINKITAMFMSDALVCLFEDLEELLAYSHLNLIPTPLTHDSFLVRVNDAIAKLQRAVTSPSQPVPVNSQSD